MNIGISVAIMLAVFAVIDNYMTNSLEKNADKYRNHPFQDRTFGYASWAKAIELIGLLGFASFFLVLVYFARDWIDVVTFSVLAIAMVGLVIYRATVWKYQKVMLREDQLICIRGKKRKLLKVNLHDIDRVDISFFRFLLHMKNGQKIVFPTGYKNQSYIYGILKYHRPKKQ